MPLNWYQKYNGLRIPTMRLATEKFALFDNADGSLPTYEDNGTQTYSTVESSLRQFLIANSKPIVTRNGLGVTQIIPPTDGTYGPNLKLKDFNLLTLNAPIDSFLYKQKMTLLPTQSNEFAGFPMLIIDNIQVSMDGNFTSNIKINATYDLRCKYPFGMYFNFRLKYSATAIDPNSVITWDTEDLVLLQLDDVNKIMILEEFVGTVLGNNTTGYIIYEFSPSADYHVSEYDLGDYVANGTRGIFNFNIIKPNWADITIVDAIIEPVNTLNNQIYAGYPANPYWIEDGMGVYTKVGRDKTTFKYYTMLGSDVGDLITNSYIFHDFTFLDAGRLGAVTARKITSTGTQESITYWDNV